MLKLTQKEIKNFNALDITSESDKEYRQGLSVFAKSYGVYGMNGAILQDTDGNFYKITARNSNLFRYC